MPNRLLLLLVLLLPALSGRAQVTADFTASQLTGCPPLPVSFTNTSAGAVRYDWNLGNGNTSTLSDPGTVYRNSGTYSVLLTAYAADGTASTKQATITVYDTSIIDFSGAPRTGCTPLPVSFAGQLVSGLPATAYQWNFGGGMSGTGQNPSTSFTDLQPFYNVVLKVTNTAGCVSTLQKDNYVQVFSRPHADFTATPTAACAPPVTVTFSNATSGAQAPYTYRWDFGDNSAAAASANPTHTYSSSGGYGVTLVATDARGCRDTAVRPAYVQIASLQAGFIGPAGQCVGTNVYFQNTTQPAAATYIWRYGDGGVSAGPVGMHQYASPGTYQVRLIATYAGCKDSVTMPVTIYPRPVPGISVVPAVPCPAPVSVQLTGSGGATYTWSFGDRTTGTGGTVSHLFDSNKIYHVLVTATSSHGCTDTFGRDLEIASLDVELLPKHARGCAPFTVHDTALVFSTAGAYPAAITGYAWTFGDGTTANQQYPVHTYSAYGTYPVSLTVTTANGCSQTERDTVHVGSPATAGFSASPLEVCLHQSIAFVDSSVGASEWEWYFGDSDSSHAQSPTHAYNFPGTYTVTQYAGNNGCFDSVKRIAYIHVNFPKARAKSKVSCTTDNTVDFINNSAGASTSHWDFGDGTSSDDTQPSHTYPGPGKYTYSLTVTNTASGCTDFTLDTVEVHSSFVSFYATDTAVCRGDSVEFIGQGGVTPGSYQWQIDGNSGTSMSGEHYKYKFTTSGYHTVRLTVVDSNECNRSVVKNNYILVSWPDVAFSVSPATCAPAVITFTDQTPAVPGTTNVAQEWAFSNGPSQSAAASSIDRYYPDGGTYSVQLRVTTSIGCTDSLAKINVIQLYRPMAKFSVSDTLLCLGETVQFHDSSQSVSTRSWAFGDGGSSGIAGPAHTYAADGTFEAREIITDTHGCTDTARQQIKVCALPVSQFTVSDTFRICPPLFDSFTNGSLYASTYLWQFGDGNVSNLANPSNVFNSGVYNVKLIAFNPAGCADTARARVRVLGYGGMLTYTPLSACAPLEVSFRALERNVPTYIYDFADGTTLGTTDTTTTHVYAVPGAYVPALVMSDGNGCSASSRGLDTIRVDGLSPKLGYQPQPACAGVPVTFTDSSTARYSAIVSHSWTFGPGDVSALSGPVRSYPIAGDYEVLLTSRTASGCSDTVRRTVRVLDGPTVTAFGDTLVCPGDSVQLSATGAASYTWQPPVALQCTGCSAPVAAPVSTTVYTVSGRDANGCAGQDTVRVRIRAKSTGTVAEGGSVCKGASLELRASGGTQYSWDPPASLSDASSSHPLASPESTTRYRVLIREGRCPADTQYVNVLLYPDAVADAGPDRRLGPGGSVPLEGATPNGERYSWTPSEGLSCADCLRPEASPAYPTLYALTVTTAKGCRSSDTVFVDVPCDASSLFMPNTFTPNGDGENDQFYPRGTGIRTITQLRIYDRWGAVVFERMQFGANDAQSGWDGTAGGKALSPDVFVYTIEGVCETGSVFRSKGDIALIR